MTGFQSLFFALPLSCFLITFGVLPVSADDHIYPLDSIERQISPRGKLKCPKSDVVRYRGTSIGYRKNLHIHSAFIAKLAAFEVIVQQVAEKHFGQRKRVDEPLTIHVVHRGSYNCRRIRRYPGWLSEHALGNALDFSGVDIRIPGVRKRTSVRVRVEKDWNRDNANGRFLRELTRVLLKKKLFRGVYGPAWPGHHDHLHFDYGILDMQEVWTGKEPNP